MKLRSALLVSSAGTIALAMLGCGGAGESEPSPQIDGPGAETAGWPPWFPPLPPGPQWPLPNFPPFVQPPPTAYGTAIHAPADCGDSDSSDGMKLIADLCNLTGDVTGCHADGPDPTCSTVEQEIFTGVTLGNKIGPFKQYGGYGGRGKAMGEAGLCVLQALKDGPPLETSVPLGLGVSGTQRIGFLSFDPATRTVRGYRQLHVDLPILGGADLRPQTFTASLVSWHHPYDDFFPHLLGNYLVDSAYALDMVMDKSAETMNLTLASIPVPTPYGPVYVQPHFSYTAGEPVALSPFGGTTQTKAPALLPPFSPIVHDVYGRFAGAKKLDSFPIGGGFGFPGVGWDSQVGLGARQEVDIWTPAAGVRPDVTDIHIPRSTVEYYPEVSVSGGAKVAYSPLNLLPSALTNGPFEITFSIYVDPHLDAKLSGQLELYYGEAAISPDVNKVTGERLDFKSGVGGKTELTIDVGMDLTICVDLLLGCKNLVNVHPKFPLTIPLGEDFEYGHAATVLMEDHTSAVPSDASWNYSEFTTLAGDTVANGRDFVEQCLAETPPEQELPPAEVTEGSMPPEWIGQWPCNICVGTKGYSDGEVSVEAISEIVSPSTSPSGPGWACTPNKVGCMDLCQWDSANNTLTVTQEKISGDQYCNPIL